MSHDESSPTLRSEMFYWHELSSGGDGTGKVYKVTPPNLFEINVRFVQRIVFHLKATFTPAK